MSATGAFFFTAFGNRKRSFFSPPNDLSPFLANSYLYDRCQYGHRQMQFIFACCFSVCTRSVLPSRCLTSFNSALISLITVWNPPEFSSCGCWKSWHWVTETQRWKGNGPSFLAGTWKDIEWEDFFFLSKMLHACNLSILEGGSASNAGHLLRN